ncbi:ribonuclease P protein component [Hugenholtzia roseola]|uniref:ribonuclease P protein component n=1 Tax=Hugenholtzia roseola TaxID=1002 RepID=UPI00040B5D37|nr:ribonuclease P protein component [Hugenholtzia roseola]
MSSQTLPKSERLYHKKVIQELFKEGSSLFSYPFKLIFLVEKEPLLSPTKPTFPALLISVGKKNFKKAHDRNRLKRQIREAYRLQKGLHFSKPAATPIRALALIYVGKEHNTTALLSQKIHFLLKKLTA